MYTVMFGLRQLCLVYDSYVWFTTVMFGLRQLCLVYDCCYW